MDAALLGEVNEMFKHPFYLYMFEFQNLSQVCNVQNGSVERSVRQSQIEMFDTPTY